MIVRMTKWKMHSQLNQKHILRLRDLEIGGGLLLDSRVRETIECGDPPGPIMLNRVVTEVLR